MPSGASRLSGEASAEFACEPSPKRMRGDDDVVDVAVGGGDVAVADGGRVVGVAVAVGTCVAVAVEPRDGPQYAVSARCAPQRRRTSEPLVVKAIVTSATF